MYAVFKTGGKQYKVKSGDILSVEKLVADLGDKVRFNEILALGPSISVLMEGYQDVNVTSLRGTLIPAKTLNRMISKIPLIGDIVIPKEVGEGLFGISFKIKGPPFFYRKRSSKIFF